MIVCDDWEVRIGYILLHSQSLLPCTELTTITSQLFPPATSSLKFKSSIDSIKYLCTRNRIFPLWLCRHFSLRFRRSSTRSSASRRAVSTRVTMAMQPHTGHNQRYNKEDTTVYISLSSLSTFPSHSPHHQKTYNSRPPSPLAAAIAFRYVYTFVVVALLARVSRARLRL